MNKESVQFHIKFRVFCCTEPLLDVRETSVLLVCMENTAHSVLFRLWSVIPAALVSEPVLSVSAVLLCFPLLCM